VIVHSAGLTAFDVVVVYVTTEERYTVWGGDISYFIYIGRVCPSPPFFCDYMEATCSGREGLASKEHLWLGVKETK
jgi:hypothetical protein